MAILGIGFLGEKKLDRHIEAAVGKAIIIWGEKRVRGIRVTE